MPILDNELQDLQNLHLKYVVSLYLSKPTLENVFLDMM